MQMTYDEWYERTAAMLIASDLPEAFVEDCLTNREAMHKLYQHGYASAEVLLHLRKQYRLEQQAEVERQRQEQAYVENCLRREREAQAERAEQEWIAAERTEQEGILALPPVTNSIGMQLKRIAVGEFLREGQRVGITHPFYLGVHEVTQEQYERVMGKNPSDFKGPQLPVEQVSWKDAVEFCAKLSALSAEKAAGRTYRLPTEAEWEYACRAGSTTHYCFGNDASGLGDYAWYSANSGRQTHPVGQKRANAWGLYDMHGNVWEWCQDWWRTEYCAKSPPEDPPGPATGSLRVSRGGSWDNPAAYCPSAFRSGYEPDFSLDDLGFRVAAVPSGE